MQIFQWPLSIGHVILHSILRSSNDVFLKSRACLVFMLQHNKAKQPEFTNKPTGPRELVI